MPGATGAVESCEKTYATLEKQVDAVLEQFVAASGSGEGFYRSMERIEEQLSAAQKLQNAETDLELNETVVLADKVEEELAAAELLATGAALSETEEEWADELEKARGSLGTLAACMKKMKSASEEGEAIEVRSAILSFRKYAKSCQERLSRLRSFLSIKKHPAYSKVESAKRQLRRLRSGVGRTFDRIVRARLRHKIAAAKSDIALFMQRSGSGRIFVDHKHLTITSGSRMERIPLTQAVRFALAEMAPVESSLAKVERGQAVMTGSYNGSVLKIGERTAAGDSIIYREKEVRLQ